MKNDHKPNGGHGPICLGDTLRGFRGLIEAITVTGDHNGVPAAEIARVEVLHEGPIAGDPIAVRVDNNTIALRRREAMSIFVA